jgi:hypothetical protein
MWWRHFTHMYESRILKSLKLLKSRKGGDKKENKKA